jgi:transcriptional regulator with XRE-family HTH domain
MKLKDKIAIAVGGNIRKIRLAKGLKQHDLARKIYRTPQHISRLEQGQLIKLVFPIYEISKALDVPIQDLFAGTENLSEDGE